MKNALFNVIFLIALNVLWHVGVSNAQEVRFSARAAAQQVGLQDPFEVQYRIENVQNVQSFQLPSLNMVQVLSGPTRNIQYRNINGQRSVLVELTYVMKARKKGTINLAPATAIADGHTFHSNALSINVIEGSTAQQPSGYYDPFEEWMSDDLLGSDPLDIIRKQQQMMRQFQQTRPQSSSASIAKVERKDINKNIFFLVEADKRNVYRGEQINVSYKLYTRLPMEISITKTPDLQGFWSQDFKLPNPPQPRNEIYKGKEYQVFEIKRTAIFPTQTGKLILDQAKAEGVVRLIKGSDANNLLNNFFGSLMDDDALRVLGQQVDEVPIQLQSEPIEINVLELPNTNKPNSFQGAIGQFTVDASINKSVIEANESATITVKINGTGNLKLAGVPLINFPAELNAFEPVVHDSVIHTPQQIVAFKEIKYTFTPNKLGNATIPSSEFSFFDTEAKMYKTIAIPSFSIQVIPQSASTEEASSNFNKPDSLLSFKKLKSWIFKPWVGVCLLLLIVLYLLVKTYVRKNNGPKQPLPQAPPRADSLQQTRSRLTRAEQHLLQGDQTAFYEEILKTLWLYLSEKLNIPLAKLSHDEADKRLKTINVDAQLKNDIFRITSVCETALYSPIKNTEQMQQVLADSIRLMEQLETTFKG